MKRILITGKNSYIGNSVEAWLQQYPDDFEVTKISLRDGSWKEMDFSFFDSILHVAGIAHNSSDPKLKDLYYKINTDLTIEVAKKAKADGVTQFVFMSSIIVYGSRKNSQHYITKDTPVNPDNFYGDSKLQAEIGIQKLAVDDFLVAILRPPMIYGSGSKGNYPKLAKLAMMTPVFPDYENTRSMLYIGNLCQLVKLIIENLESGFFYPQNNDYVRTSELVRLIAMNHRRRIFLIKIFNPIIRHSKSISLVRKIFGDLVYEKSMSVYDKSEYRLWTLEQSISDTESGRNFDEGNYSKLF